MFFDIESGKTFDHGTTEDHRFFLWYENGRISIDSMGAVCSVSFPSSTLQKLCTKLFASNSFNVSEWLDNSIHLTILREGDSKMVSIIFKSSTMDVNLSINSEYVFHLANYLQPLCKSYRAYSTNENQCRDCGGLLGEHHPLCYKANNAYISANERMKLASYPEDYIIYNNRDSFKSTRYIPRDEGYYYDALKEILTTKKGYK